jgi:hypothetical protein
MSDGIENGVIIRGGVSRYTILCPEIFGTGSKRALAVKPWEKIC